MLKLFLVYRQLRCMTTNHKRCWGGDFCDGSEVNCQRCHGSKRLAARMFQQSFQQSKDTCMSESEDWNCLISAKPIVTIFHWIDWIKWEFCLFFFQVTQLLRSKQSHSEWYGVKCSIMKKSTVKSTVVVIGTRCLKTLKAPSQLVITWNVWDCFMVDFRYFLILNFFYAFNCVELHVGYCEAK